MEVTFDVKMTSRLMYDFLMYHTYTSVSGMLSIVLGIAALLVCATTIGSMEYWQSILYAFFGIWFLIYMPISLYMRAVKQIKTNQVFEKPIRYRISQAGIATSQGHQVAETKWEDIIKVRETKFSLLIYTGKRNSFVLPKESIGENYQKMIEIIKINMDPKKIKLRRKSEKPV